MNDIKTLSDFINIFSKNIDLNDININHLEIDYITYINLEIIKNIDLNDININNLEIDYIIYINLEIIKILESKNFNFELLTLENIVNIIYDENIITYLINNNLYNFLNKDKFNILKYCHNSTFEFWISYLNINVYDEYNGHTLHYFIYNSDYNDKCNHLIINYKSYMNKKDIIELSKNDGSIFDYIYECVITNKYIDIDYFINFKDDYILNTLLIIILDNYYDNTYEIYINKLIIDIEILDKKIILYSFYNKCMYYSIFEKIINKLNMKLSDIIDYIKLNNKYGTSFDLLFFVNLYYLYDKDIINYINLLFDINNYQEFENLYYSQRGATLTDDVINNIKNLYLYN